MAFGCGQCIACRINRSRLWVGRMLLEMKEHPACSFITLTYRPENLPAGGCVVKKHAQLFMKRLREEIKPRQVRYYLVGEYGERTQRPHYHAVLFGVGVTEGNTVQKCWPHGFIHIGSAESRSMSYVAGYICKGMTKKSDKRLAERPPEFCCMSLRPGIGHGVTSRMVEVLEGKSLEQSLGVPSDIRIDGKRYPLGRYLRRKVEEKLGLSDSQVKQWQQQKWNRAAEKNLEKTATQMETERKAKVAQQWVRPVKKTL